jgi:hypothetical protein
MVPPYTLNAAVRPPHKFTPMKGGIPMKNYEEIASTRLDQPPAPRWRGRRWLLIGGLAFAFMLALAVGALIGSSTGVTQAAAVSSGSSNNSQTLTFAQGGSNSSQALGNDGSSQSQGNAQGPQPNRRVAARSRSTRQRAPATTRLARLSPRAPSRLAPGLTSWERTTAMEASLPQALTSGNSAPSTLSVSP